MKNSILKTVLTLLTFSVILSTVLAQAPESFSYQAIVRNNAGQPLADTSVTFQFNIHQGSASGTLVYSENHSVTTNDFGLVNLQIGQGTVNSGDFATIDWGNDSYFLNVQIDQGSGFVDMGTQQFISVPYAMYAKNAGSSGVAGNSGDIQLNKNGKISADPDLHWDFTKNKFTVGQSADDGRMIIQQDANAPDTIPILEVKNKAGQTVFVVYPDSVHFFIKDDNSKGVLKGGFAVSGRSGTSVSKNDYLVVRPDSTRIYFKESGAKGVLKGGFAVSGRSGTKSGTGQEYFNISPNTTANIINPSEARILWYPNKEAFLTGRVLIESPDSVGTNSFVTGFESKAIGNYSQALGYRSKARGDYSIAIGDSTMAIGDYSFALGGPGEYWNYSLGSYVHVNAPKALSDYSYSFGMGCISNSYGAVSFGMRDTASGDNSLTMGYHCVATGWCANVIGGGAHANGDFSIAMGLGSIANDAFSIAMGRDAITNGEGGVAIGYFTTAEDYCTAMGKYTIAEGMASTAIGAHAVAKGYVSTALGEYTLADGDASTAIGSESVANAYVATAIGDHAVATGYNSIAMGYYTKAKTYCATIIGSFNDTSFVLTNGYNQWKNTDPIFVVGNGYYDYDAHDTIRHNAVTVLKNGNVGINTNTADKLLTVDGDARVTGDIYYGTSSNTYDKPDFVFKPNYTKDFSIDYIERYINRHGHLPWLTAAKDEKDGINMTRMSFQTLEAVENQQLQIIQLRKENKDLLKRIEQLEKAMKKIKK